MTDIPQPTNIGSSILKGGCPIVCQHGHDHHPTTSRLEEKNVVPRGTPKKNQKSLWENWNQDQYCRHPENCNHLFCKDSQKCLTCEETF